MKIDFNKRNFFILEYFRIFLPFLDKMGQKIKPGQLFLNFMNYLRNYDKNRVFIFFLFKNIDKSVVTLF